MRRSPKILTMLLKKAVAASSIRGFAGLEYAFAYRFAINVTGLYFGLSDTVLRAGDFDVDAQPDSIVATPGFT